MEKAKEISSKCWKLFKDFVDVEKTEDSWGKFIDTGREMTESYEGIEKELAMKMFLAFQDYIDGLERKEHKH